MTSRPKRRARRVHAQAFALARALALVAACLGWSGPAEADEAPVTFSLRLGGADGGTSLDACGGRAALEKAVEERLHREVFAREHEDEADIAFDVTLGAAQGSAYTAHIVERDREGAELGVRDVTIEASRCEKGIDTLAVVLAIMIGPPRTKTVPVAPPTPDTTPPPPDTTPPPDAPPPSPPPPLPPPPRGEPRAPRPRSPSPEERPRWEISPTVEMAIGTGVLPDAALGFQGGVVLGVPVRRVSFLARGYYWLPRSTGTSAKADVDRLGGSIAGCYGVVRSGMVALDTCVGFDAARLRTSSLDLTRPSEVGAVLDVFGEARFGYRVPTTGKGNGLVVEPVVAVQLAAILRRDRFTYRDRTLQERTLLQPAPVAFQASFGVAFHFL